MGERSSEFKVGDSVDIVYTIDEDRWQGNRKLATRSRIPCMSCVIFAGRLDGGTHDHGLCRVGDMAAQHAFAHELKSGHLLTYVGEGHTAYGRGDACIDTKVDAYLTSRQLPRAGA